MHEAAPPGKIFSTLEGYSFGALIVRIFLLAKSTIARGSSRQGAAWQEPCEAAATTNSVDGLLAPLPTRPPRATQNSSRCANSLSDRNGRANGCEPLADFSEIRFASALPPSVPPSHTGSSRSDNRHAASFGSRRPLFGEGATLTRQVISSLRLPHQRKRMLGDLGPTRLRCDHVRRPRIGPRRHHQIARLRCARSRLRASTAASASGGSFARHASTFATLVGNI